MAQGKSSSRWKLSVTIKASDHKNSLGNYRADLYVVDNNDNNRHYVTETIVTVKHDKPTGIISVVNNNKDTGYL